jgi:hypothetical protein
MGGGFGGIGAQQQMQQAQQAQQVPMGMPFQAGAAFDPSLSYNPMQTASPLGGVMGLGQAMGNNYGGTLPGINSTNTTTTQDMMGGNRGAPQTNMAANLSQMFNTLGQQPAQQAMQRQYAQPGQDYRTVSPQQMDQMRGLNQQMDAYMQTSPAMKQMQDLQAKIQGGQITPQAGRAQVEALNAQLRDYQQNAPMMQQIQALQQAMPQAGQMSPDMQQANAQRAFDQMQSGMGQQPAGIAGLAGLLGGMPNQPTPTAPPVSTTQPAPVAAKPAPVAAKPSVVPPKTPPAVASAIQKLAAKKPMMRR